MENSRIQHQGRQKNTVVTGRGDFTNTLHRYTVSVTENTLSLFLSLSLHLLFASFFLLFFFLLISSTLRDFICYVSPAYGLNFGCCTFRAYLT